MGVDISMDCVGMENLIHLLGKVENKNRELRARGNLMGHLRGRVRIKGDSSEMKHVKPERERCS